MLFMGIFSTSYGAFLLVSGFNEKDSKILRISQIISGLVIVVMGLLIAIPLESNAQVAKDLNAKITIHERGLERFEGLELIDHLNNLENLESYVVEKEDGNIIPLKEYYIKIVELNSPHIMKVWNNDSPKYFPEYEEKWLCINGYDTTTVNVYYAMIGHIIADYGMFGKVYNTKAELKEALLYIARGGLSSYRSLLKEQKIRKQ